MIAVQHGPYRPSGRRRKSRPGRLAGAFGLAFAVSVCLSGAQAAPQDDLPMLGDRSSALISPALEKQIGRDFLKQVHSSLRTVRSAAFSPTLRALARRSGWRLMSYQ